MTPLRYKPRRRFVGRVDVAGSPHSILKLHSPAGYQQARRAAKSLLSLPSIFTAPLVGHSNRHSAVLLGWLPGQSLASQWNRPAAELCAAVREAGELLAALHGQGPLKLPTTTPEAQLAALSKLPAELAALSPQLADQTRDLVANALSLYGKLDRPITSLHGDFTPDQILTGDRVALIDFDNAVLGPAEQDLGTFLAHLEKAGCDGRLDPAAAQCLFDELLTAYRSAGGQVDTSAVSVYAVVGILKLIQEPFRLRMPTWLRHSLKLVERAAARLGESSPARQRVSCCTNAGPFAEDLALRATHPALDLTTARQALTPLLCEAYSDPSLEIVDSRLLRHKLGRRCLIEYTCASGQRNQQFRVLGKAHAKPKHRQAYRLQRTLWDQGFHDDTADKIVVSRPLIRR